MGAKFSIMGITAVVASTFLHADGGLDDPFSFQDGLQVSQVCKPGHMEEEQAKSVQEATHLWLARKQSDTALDLEALKGQGHISSLLIEKMEVSDAEALALAQLDFWPTLKHISFQGCRFSMVGMSYIRAALERAAGLETLQLYKQAYAPEFLLCVSKDVLKHLRVTRLPLRTQAEHTRQAFVNGIAVALSFAKGLLSLDLSDNDLGDSELSAILSGITPGLYALNIAKNHTGPHDKVGKMTFGAMQQFAELGRLNLSDLQISPCGSQDVALALSAMPVLTTLDLSNNCPAGGTLGRVLAGAPQTLTHLTMNYARYVDPKDWDAVTRLKNLISVHAQDCDVNNNFPTSEEDAFEKMGLKCETFLTTRVKFRDGTLVVNGVEDVM